MSDKEPPKRPPVTSTTLFRVLNPELFLRPNKYVMAFGLGALTLSLGFVWWQSEGQLGPNASVQAGYPRISEYLPETAPNEKNKKASRWD